MNSLRGMGKAFGIRLPRRRSENFAERAQAALAEELGEALSGLIESIEFISGKIEEYDERIEAVARERYPEVGRLSKIPGIGVLTALTFVVTLGHAGRFEHSRDVGGYVGLTPAQRQSGETDPQLPITKAGDGYLWKLLVQSAHCVLRSKQASQIRQWGVQSCERGGKNGRSGRRWQLRGS